MRSRFLCARFESGSIKTSLRTGRSNDLLILPKDFQSFGENINHRVNFRLTQHSRECRRAGVDHHETSLIQKINEEFNLLIFRWIGIRLPISRGSFGFQVNTEHRTSAGHAGVGSDGLNRLGDFHPRIISQLIEPIHCLAIK